MAMIGFPEAKPKIGWVVCGGESGPKARVMHPDWARSLRDQCQAAGVAFFFKQYGEWAPFHNGKPKDPLDFIMPDGLGSGVRVFKIGKKRAGRLLDGREWNEFPEQINAKD